MRSAASTAVTFSSAAATPLPGSGGTVTRYRVLAASASGTGNGARVSVRRTGRKGTKSPLADVAASLGITHTEAEKRLGHARHKLFAARERRVRPGRDDKVLASWNALMIGGLAHAARVFGKAEWLASARKALEFLRSRMWRDGRLLATYKDGRAHLDAYLDDYAFLLAALLELMQADFDPRDLDQHGR